MNQLNFDSTSDGTSSDNGYESDTFLTVPEEAVGSMRHDAEAVGGEWVEPEAYKGSVGRTMFDTPSSKDNTLTVLLPRESMDLVPAQSLVSINSIDDNRKYLGVVVEGPFAEPDGIRGDAPIVVTTTVKGGIFMPKFHGRVHVELLGEQIGDALMPPRFRPLPNSPVFVLDQAATEAVLKLNGDIRLGLAEGHEALPVSIPSDRKSVLPRHIGILGTTGGGKSTTVSGIVNRFQKAGIATVLIDTEGEYTMIDERTDNSKMLAALDQRKISPIGIESTRLFHLIGRETTNPEHPNKTTFCLSFDRLSPYLVMELLELTSAQEERYLRAYDVTKLVLKALEISPVKGEDTSTFYELDEMEEGYPRMTLDHMYDVIVICAQLVDKNEGAVRCYAPGFRGREAQVLNAVKQAVSVKDSKKPEVALPGHAVSWRALQGRIGRIRRLRIFDNPKAAPIDYNSLITSGQVSIFDLSDVDSPQINNLIIAELLRGIQQKQNAAYKEAEEKKELPPRTMVVIEEAHEFLSAERIKQMPVLSQQVARIARRGRKRWLGLAFVTQLPQHLPDEVLGLINNYILHKIADAGVISRLKRSIGGIDAGLWSRLPNLAPGQAIVSMSSMTRPLLVSIDPTPCKLRMMD